MKKKHDNQPQQLTLLQLFDSDNERLRLRVGHDRSERTYANRLQSRRHVAAYMQQQWGQADMPLSKLTPLFISDFASWLSAVRGLRGGTVWLLCQQLKGVVTRAYLHGLMSQNPFHQFHQPKNIRPRQYLTRQELQLLAAHCFSSDALTRTRDIFIFAALTGLSFADLQRLTWANITSLGDELWITAMRRKTGVPFQVMLLPAARTILSRQPNAGTGSVFGQLTYRTTALRLQRVMQQCGISKHITMHCARHSFAIMALECGMPIESLSRVLGHTNISTTQLYARITMQKLRMDFLRLAKNVEK